MFSLESDEMTALWSNDSSTFTFYVIILNNIPNWATFVKEVFDPMFSLESDEMTALCANNSLTSIFYVILKKHTKLSISSKISFWFGV